MDCVIYKSAKINDIEYVLTREENCMIIWEVNDDRRAIKVINCPADRYRAIDQTYEIYVQKKLETNGMFKKN